MARSQKWQQMTNGRGRSAMRSWAVAVLLQMGLAACASAPPAPVPERPAPELPELTLDHRVALVLRLETQRTLRDAGVAAAVMEPGAFAPARTADLVALLHDVDPSVRRRAALAIGRVGMADGVEALVAGLADTDPAVRAEAAFGLGLIGRADAAPSLIGALADDDPMVRGRAAEGLGLIAAQLPGPEAAAFSPEPAAAVGEAFAGCGPRIAPIAPDDEEYPKAPEIESCRLAIFALTRLRQFEPLARVVLAPDGRAVSAWWPVAYALQRVGDARAAPVLALLARTAGIYTVAFALRSAGATPDGIALARRFALDAAADPRVRVVAIRALGRRGSADGAEALTTLLDTPRLSDTILLEVMNALAATGDPRAVNRMIDRLSDSRPQVRSAALAGLARIDPDGFLLAVSSLGFDRDFSVRATLANTLGALDPDRVRSGLIEMTEDQDQRVRGPAIEALARVGSPDLAERLFAALEAPDFVVRATAARVIGERKIPGAVGPLAAAYDRGLSDAAFDARAAALGALAAIGGDAAFAEVRRGLSDRDWPVRLRAAELLRAAGDATAEPLRPAPLRQPADFFASDALLHPQFTPVALIETRRGTIEITLNVVEAPLTTRNFVELARAGFFNGLRVHRLVPNFVVQAGDPRGDGEGGPGYSIPDELSQLPYRRGTVGMAKSWGDTAGSQFFITLSPQPHLDGRYTVFGQVVKGMDVVDQLTLYDAIERIRIWDGVDLK